MVDRRGVERALAADACDGRGAAPVGAPAVTAETVTVLDESPPAAPASTAIPPPARPAAKAAAMVPIVPRLMHSG